MILSCPACATRYRVADQEFEGSIGRTVRCANCGHLWYEARPIPQTPDSGEQLIDKAAAVSEAPTSDPPTKPDPPPIPRLEISSSPPPSPPRGRFPGSGIAAMLVLVVALVIAGIFVHRYFAAAPPLVVRSEIATDPPATAPGTGLVIRKITPARTADGLVVDGEIVNSGNMPRDVPRLRVALEDSTERELEFKTVDPPKPRLKPGEVVHFETSFADPTGNATGVVVTFSSS